MADALTRLTPEWLKESGAGARRRAEAMFSKNAVIGEYIRYYERVAAGREEDEPREGTKGREKRFTHG